MTLSQDQNTIKGSGIPQDLEKQVSNRFNKLHSEGHIIWQPFSSENAEDKGFKAFEADQLPSDKSLASYFQKVQFQTAPHLTLKPHNPIDSSNAKKTQKINPFANPDPPFVLAYPGPNHTLILNKFPVYKDSLIIHTNDFKLQSDDLDQSDLAACWHSLQALYTKVSSDHKQWTMIYNCGRQAGSSQGHKHMQIWPIPPTSELGFELFVDKAESTANITSVPNIPFKHFIIRLSPQADVLEITTAYVKLLAKVKQVHADHGSTAYNVAMTNKWLMLVPRCNSGGGYGFGGNTAVVLGLIWISGPNEKQLWDDYGIWKHMTRLGVPA